MDFPIFAVDYRLAPEFKFPSPIKDVIASIFWIKQLVNDVIGIQVEEFILMGDSAGANLIVSACLWLIESEIWDLPVMLSLSYPVVSIRYF